MPTTPTTTERHRPTSLLGAAVRKLFTLASSSQATSVGGMFDRAQNTNIHNATFTINQYGGVVADHDPHAGSGSGGATVRLQRYDSSPSPRRESLGAYVDYLLIKNCGYPLWIPSPTSLPILNRQLGVSLGEIGPGVFTPEGGFIYLFNVFHDASYPINAVVGVQGGSVPFSQIVGSGHAEFVQGNAGFYMWNPRMVRADGGDNQLKTVLEPRVSEAAVLVIPEEIGGARMHETATAPLPKGVLDGAHIISEAAVAQPLTHKKKERAPRQPATKKKREARESAPAVTESADEQLVKKKQATVTKGGAPTATESANTQPPKKKKRATVQESLPAATVTISEKGGANESTLATTKLTSTKPAPKKKNTPKKSAPAATEPGSKQPELEKVGAKEGTLGTTKLTHTKIAPTRKSAPKKIAPAATKPADEQLPKKENATAKGGTPTAPESAECADEKPPKKKKRATVQESVPSQAAAVSEETPEQKRVAKTCAPAARGAS